MKIVFLCLLFLCASCSYYSAEDQLYVSQLAATKTFYRWDTGETSHRIHYLEKGTGEKHIVLIHGFAANTYTWHHQIDLLAAKGYHVWAIDLLGFGFSDKPIQDYHLEMYQTQLVDFMNSMHIPKAHLVGHSMGGAVSLGLATTVPDRIRSLTLIAPAAYPQDLPFRLSLGKTLGKFFLPFFSKNMIRQTLHSIFFDSSKVTEEQVDAYWLPYRMEGGREAMLSVLSAFDKETLARLSASYSKIKLPTFIIWGEKDTWISPNFLQSFKTDIPQAEQLLLPDCGHAPQEEFPETVNQSVLKFLVKVEK